MPRRRREPEEEESENHERWMVTYADMITLLMVLFIVLFAMSQVDEQKFHELRAGLREQFGEGPTLLDGGSSVLAAGGTSEPSLDIAAGRDALDIAAAREALERQRQAEEARRGERAALERVRRTILAHLTEHGLADAVRFRIDERGLVVSIVTDQVLFDLGSAELQPKGREVLDAVAPALLEVPNSITIEGHTDDLPIAGGRYPSNWELSTYRATTVLRYLLDQGVPPPRLSAVGYADQRPVVPNDSPDHRVMNRRVAVVIRSMAHTAGTEPAGGTALAGEALSAQEEG